jgi:hypothetical protein
LALSSRAVQALDQGEEPEASGDGSGDGWIVVMSELLVLARRLYARRATGTVVPYRVLDQTHVEGQCHNNADRWANDNPGWKSVRGWLVFDHEATSSGIIPLVQFNPHSVVEDSNGIRVDPTPSRASQRYPFLEHEGPEEDFIRIVESISLTCINYDTLSDSISVAAG